MNTNKSIVAVLLLIAVLALILVSANSALAQGPDDNVQIKTGQIQPYTAGALIDYTAELPVEVDIESTFIIKHHVNAIGQLATVNIIELQEESSLGPTSPLTPVVAYGNPNTLITMNTIRPGKYVVTGTILLQPNLGFGVYTTTLVVNETPCWALKNYALNEAEDYYTLEQLQQCPGYLQPIIVPSGILTATPEPTMTLTNTPTPTESPSPTATQTNQGSPTSAPAQNNTATETPTNTPTPTESPTNTPTNTMTSTSVASTPNPQTSITAQQQQDPQVLHSFDVNDQHPWPATNPMPSATVATVGACQTSVGVYDANTKERWFDVSTAQLWTAMTKFCLTGGVWLKDIPAQGIVFENVTHLLGTTQGAGSTTTNLGYGKCGSLTPRNAGLHCATDEYWAHGIGLEGFKAMLTSYNATYTSLVFSYEDDDWQPDSDMLDNVETFWGGLGNFVGLKVVGNTVIVTDDPTKVTSYEWAMQDLRGTQRPIWHFGGATTPNDREVRVAVHLDGSDWQEIAAAMKCKCVIVTQKDGSFGPKD